MPSSLTTFEAFDACLVVARAELASMLAAEPDYDAISVVAEQLDRVYTWTRGGRCPNQSEKNQLNFGHIATHELDDYPVANSLVELASFVIYWGEDGGIPR